MKCIKTILLLGLLTFSFSATSQCTDATACNFTQHQNAANDICLSIDTILVHDGVAIPELSGQTTYRLYVNFPADKSYYLTAVAGATSPNPAVNILPTNISTTTSFYKNEAVNIVFADDINPIIWSSIPSAEYDSWVTIIGEDQTFSQNIQGQGTWEDGFEEGNNIEINDEDGGLWYINGQNPIINTNNPIGGPGFSALIGQFTTDGTLSADVSVEYFEVGAENTIGFSNLSTDNACAYGDCVFPPANLDCNFNCVNDTDNDGVCDEFEVLGCTDINACNYNPNATESDPSQCTTGCLNALSSVPCGNVFTLTYNSEDYDLVEIDGRCWFAKDLKTTINRNGVDISLVTDPTAWSELDEVNAGNATYFIDGGIGETYMSYNWYAVESGLLCPSGWHVANNSDWNSLEKEVFGTRTHRLSRQSKLVVGNVSELHEAGWFHQYTAPGIFDESTFSGGLRDNVDGIWRDANGSIYWWTAEAYTPKATESRANSAWARGVKKDASWGIFRDLWSTSNSKNNALRVRCVKGE